MTTIKLNEHQIEKIIQKYVDGKYGKGACIDVYMETEYEYDIISANIEIEDRVKIDLSDF